ncbi:MAG: hypothetical protein MJZ86_07725 [Bacteroidales bacterium]|nr:hypothetical protein [Bacteroidales bacterium]
MRNRKLAQISAIILTLVYVGYFIDGHFFVHKHQLSNRVVVHSHPHAHSHHSHSTNELLTLDQLTHYDVLLHHPMAFSPGMVYGSAEYENHYCCRLVARDHYLWPTKAPPSLVISSPFHLGCE